MLTVPSVKSIKPNSFLRLWNSSSQSNKRNNKKNTRIYRIYRGPLRSGESALRWYQKIWTEWRILRDEDESIRRVPGSTEYSLRDIMEYRDQSPDLQSCHQVMQTLLVGEVLHNIWVQQSHSECEVQVFLELPLQTEATLKTI